MKLWQTFALGALFCLISINQTKANWLSPFSSGSTENPNPEIDSKHYINEEGEELNGTDLSHSEEEMEIRTYGSNEGVPIQDIDHLGDQNNAANGYGMVESDAPTFERQPQNSPFLGVDPSSHPTESRGPDPRFQVERSCQDGQYLCRKASPHQTHVRCIPNDWKCNGVRDCEENDDEESCAINAHRVMNRCTANQYTCRGTGINGIPAQCVDQTKICDNVYDCSHGDDEHNCAGRYRPDPSNPTRADPYDNYARQQPGQSQPPEPSAQNEQPTFTAHSNPAASRHPYPGPTPPGQQPTLVPDCSTSTRSEEYVKRLEWRDRCYRSCMKN